MKVKIVKSSQESYWYSNEIGSVFNVEEHDYEDYRLIDKSLYLVKKTDCKIISEIETTPFKPRMMWVSDESEEHAKLVANDWLVVGKDILGRYIGYYAVKTIEDVGNDKTTSGTWRFAVDIEEEQAPEFTAEQVAYLDKHYIKK